MTVILRTSRPPYVRLALVDTRLRIFLTRRDRIGRPDAWILPGRERAPDGSVRTGQRLLADLCGWPGELPGTAAWHRRAVVPEHGEIVEYQEDIFVFRRDRVVVAGTWHPIVDLATLAPPVYPGTLAHSLLAWLAHGPTRGAATSADDHRQETA